MPPDWNHFWRYPVNGDWDLFTHLRWVPYYTVSHFHQLPFWDPYRCGGMPMLGNPESSIVSPFLLGYLLIGPHAGLWIEIFAHYALGFAGGYFLGRVLSLSIPGALVCAAVYPSSSWLPLHLSVGHLNFLPALYLPWIVALYLLSIQHRLLWPAAIAGAIAALTFTEGNYALLYAVLTIGLLTPTLCIMHRSSWPIAAAAIVGGLAVFLAAPKLLPVWQLLSAYPRPPFGPEFDHLHDMWIYLFSRYQDLYRNGVSVFLFCEYGAYLPWLFAGLGLLGIVISPRRSIVWILPAILFFWLAMGDTGEHSALLYLRKLPMMKEIDLPARFIIPFIFCAGVLAAIGTDYVCKAAAPLGNYAAVGILIVGLLDAWTVGSPNLRYLFHNENVTYTRASEFQQYWIANPGTQTAMAQANMGSVNCQGYGYCSIPENPRGSNQVGYRGEYYLLGPGSIVQTSWSPNKLEFNIDSPAATAMVVNQNYFQGWQAAPTEMKVYSESGLLAVKVPAGKSEVELIYRPQHLLAVTSLAISGLAALILVCIAGV